MAITMEQLQELYRDVARIQTDIQDIESHARSTRNGSRNNVLDQRDRDTVAMVIDGAAARQKAKLDKILSEITIKVEGV
jgi:predicted  nucleic acid-binding Zn-ribbon protein